LVISDVSICNSALSKLGAERITSLNDQTAAGVLCKEQYEKLRDSLLMEHPWKFAIARANLALTVFVPTWQYTKAFQLPVDVLRILDTDQNQGTIGEVSWDMEIDPNTGERYLVTNEDAVAIKYLKKVSETRFTPLFAEVLAARLSKEFAYPLTQSSTITQLMAKNYDDMLKMARSFNAMESSVKQVEANDWFFSRF
jgi:hypothetical protein